MKIRLSRQSGSALVVTIVITAIIGTTLAAYLNMTSTQHRAVVRSQAWGAAIVMAEAGIEEALQAVVSSGHNLAAQGWTSNANVFSMSRDLGEGRYVASISNYPPTIYCTGYRATPLGTNELARTVRVSTRNAPLFGKALVAKGLIDIANGYVDSFDSGGGGDYSAAVRRSGGDVTSINNNILVGDFGEIRGNAGVSPGHSINSLGDIGPIGTTGTKAGFTSYISRGTIPEPVLPSGVGPNLGTALNLSAHNGAVTLTGTADSGNYFTSGNGNFNADLTVTGGAQVTLYVSGRTSRTGESFIKISANSSLWLVTPPSTEQA